MDDDLLFKFQESRLEAAIRWQKRALKAEARVVVLEKEALSDLGTLTHVARRLGVERSAHTLRSIIGLLEARVEVLEKCTAVAFAFKERMASAEVRVKVLETDQARDDEIILKLRALVEELEARLSRRNERVKTLQKCQDRLRELDNVAQSGEGESGGLD